MCMCGVGQVLRFQASVVQERSFLMYREWPYAEFSKKKLDSSRKLIPLVFATMCVCVLVTVQHDVGACIRCRATSRSVRAKVCRP